MKKLLVMALAIAMILTLSVSVFAAELPVDSEIENDGEGWNGTGNTGDVTVTVDTRDPENPEDPVAKVYKVDIAWDSLEFVFNGVWDPESGMYKCAADEGGFTGSGWQNNERDIVITNKSNAEVKASAAIDTATQNGVTAALANAAETTLASAADANAANGATAKTVTVTVSGNPTADNFKVGTITVTLATAD